jgi:outer membrane protein W
VRRRRSRSARTCAAALLVVALAVVLVAPGSSFAQSDRRSRWRTSRYGRQGAELWLEAPRVGLATGSGYTNGVELPGGDGDEAEDLNLSSGLGFGFGVMFAFSDKVALEGRVVQTNHEVSGGDRNWDLDQLFVGGRYIFFHDRPIQVFVGAGAARHTLEFDSSESLLTEFERVSGYGWYVATGVDYVVSSRWVIGLRSDYVSMNYNRIQVGTSENDIEDPLDGSVFGVSLSINYRVPIWW